MKDHFDETESGGNSRLYGRRAFWFVMLWCGGFIATLLISLPFKLLVRAAMH